MRGRRSLILAAAAALAAACTAAPAAATTTATSSPTLALAALRSLPANSATVGMIEINNLDAIEAAAGISAPPTLRQLKSRAFGEVAAQVLTGSPVGSPLWVSAVQGDPAPLGYPVLSMREELAVGGGLGASLGETWGSISPAAVAARLRSSGPRVSTVGRERVYDFGRVFPIRRGPVEDLIPNTRFLAVPDSGGRIVAGGRGASESPVLDLAAGGTVAHSVGALPQIAEMQRAFGSHLQSEAMGTDLIMKPAVYAERLPPARLKRILEQTGLSRLPRPLIVGLADIAGGPRTQTVLTAAVYRSAAAARIAEPILRRATATGTSAKYDEPNSRLWHVQNARVEGDVVVMRLLTRSDSATASVRNFDFPPFWS